MSATISVTFWCDRRGCLKHIRTGMPYVAGAREQATADGWQVKDDEQSFCPEHSE